MDRVAWSAAIHGVTKCRTQLSDCTEQIPFIYYLTIFFFALRKQKMGQSFDFPKDRLLADTRTEMFFFPLALMNYFGGCFSLYSSSH